MPNNAESGPDRHYDELEIDLREYILLLWRKKWVIMGLVVVAVIAAYFYTVITTDVQYKATSKILLMPPRHTEVDISRMGRSTYADLAQSDDLLRRIIEKLDLRDGEGELLHPSAIERRMELEIIEDDGIAEEEESFIMRMEVTGTDPEESSDIANSWAELFQEDNLEIRRGEIEEIFEVTERRFTETQENLEQAEEKMEELKQEARLERLTDQKETYRANLRDVEKGLLSLQEELGAKEILQENKSSQVAKREIDGIWQNEIFSYLQEEPDGYENEDVKNLLQAHQRFAAASKENLRLELEQIETVLAEEPEKISLIRNLSDDVFWDNIFSPEELEILADIEMEEEVLNAVHERLRQEKADTEIAFHSIFGEEAVEGDFDFRGALEYYGPEAASLLELDVENYLQIYENEQENYLNLKHDLANLELEIEDLEVEIGYYSSRSDDLADEVGLLEEQVWEFDRLMGNIERDVNRYEKSYERLSSEMEDARLAMAEQTSDVRFVSAAVPPGRTIGRGTTLNMAIAAVLAGMLGVFGIFFQEFMKEE